MKTITQKLDPHAAACGSKNKNCYICISEESEGSYPDTLFETLPIHLHLLEILLVVLFEEFENGACFFGFSQVGVSDSLGRDIAVRFEQRVILFLDSHPDIVQ